MIKKLLEDKKTYKKVIENFLKEKVKEKVKLFKEEVAANMIAYPKAEEESEQDVSFEVDGVELNPKAEEEPEQKVDLLKYALDDESTEEEKAFALKNTEAGNGDASADESCQKLKEVAPPGPEAEKFINDNKEEFKKRYGDGWEGVLYATAWDKFGNK